MKFQFTSGLELLSLCKEKQMKIWEIILKREMELSDCSEKDIFSKMEDFLNTMKEAVKTGIETDVKSVSGLIGGDAKKVFDYGNSKKSLSGMRTLKSVAYSMAVLEVNASMGQIIAAPTAGSCGILPGVLLAAGEDLGYDDTQLIKGLLTASAIGYLFARNATVSGAEGGCQAETGTAAAMAAAAMVELENGSPEMALHAASITIKNILGLVCDPIAGLVESPCEKRNAIGATNALISADLSLAGVESIIPFDEVVSAMFKVGKLMSPTLKETAMGGLATTPTGQKICKKIFGGSEK